MPHEADGGHAAPLEGSAYAGSPGNRGDKSGDADTGLATPLYSRL